MAAGQRCSLGEVAETWPVSVGGGRRAASLGAMHGLEGLACIGTSHIVTSDIVMAHTVMAFLVVAHIAMVCLALAYTVVAYVGMAYTVMAYIVMASMDMASEGTYRASQYRTQVYGCPILRSGCQVSGVHLPSLWRASQCWPLPCSNSALNQLYIRIATGMANARARVCRYS